VPEGVRFAVNTVSQASNVFDWVAMRLVGDSKQASNWIKVVERVVALSGGESARGVIRDSHPLGKMEQQRLDRWITRLIQEQQRTKRMSDVAASGALAG